ANGRSGRPAGGRSARRAAAFLPAHRCAQGRAHRAIRLVAVLLALFHRAHHLHPLRELPKIALPALARRCRSAPASGEGAALALVGIERVVVADLERRLEAATQFVIAAAAAVTRFKLEFLALVIRGSFTPLNCGAAPLVVHDA